METTILEKNCQSRELGGRELVGIRRSARGSRRSQDVGWIPARGLRLLEE